MHVVPQGERKGREALAARAQPWRALVFKRGLGRRSSRSGREGGGWGSGVLAVQRCGVRRKLSLPSQGAGAPRSEVCRGMGGVGGWLSLVESEGRSSLWWGQDG